MKYESDSGKILISCREFVSIARRGISVAVPTDADEPELHKTSRGLLNKILGERRNEEIIWGFDACSYSFELICHADKIDECNLWFTNLHFLCFLIDILSLLCQQSATPIKCARYYLCNRERIYPKRIYPRLPYS